MNRETRTRISQCMVTLSAMILPVALGCGQGLVVGTQSEAATLNLVADSVGALQLEECVATGELSSCARYPNPYACSSLKVLVNADGETDAFCYQQQGEKLVRSRVTEAIPFMCSSAWSDGCLRCVDLFGQEVLAECGDATGAGGGSPEAPGEDSTDGEGGLLASSSPVFLGAGHEPEVDADLADTIEVVLSEYAAVFNEILAEEGIDLLYVPDFNGVDDMASDPILDWIAASLGFMEGICQFADDLGLLDEGLDSAFCWTNMGGNQICRCAAMVAASSRLTCRFVDTLGEVDPRVYAALWLEMGNVINWLLGLGNIDVPEGGDDSSDVPGEDTEVEDVDIGALIDNMDPAQTIIDITTIDDGVLACTGSPLVLDLEDDGIALTSVEQGTQFDLHGHGPVSTAWVQGDDALLVLDRNSNGAIDGASELFGEGLDLDGSPSADGFRALSLVDTARHGGDGNGRVDAGDALFAAMRLWNDRNRDGRSQSGELRRLDEAGVSSLSFDSTYEPGRRDAHGNDLGMRGSFARAGGQTGSMVDAYFRFALPE